MLGVGVSGVATDTFNILWASVHESSDCGLCGGVLQQLLRTRAGTTYGASILIQERKGLAGRLHVEAVSEGSV